MTPTIHPREIIALDLSLTSTGWASHDGHGTITSPKVGTARLADIRDQILDLAGRRTRLAAIEGYAVFNARGNTIARLGELGGVIRLALHERGILVVEIPPSSLKRYATGKGNAGKPEMVAAAIRRLDYPGHQNDEADALWLYELTCDWYGAPTRVPASHRTGLEKITWPTLDSLRRVS